MGDIYFSFDFSKQFGYLLTNEYGVHVTSNSYGSSEVDNDGMDAASHEADLIHADRSATRPRRSSRPATARPGFGTSRRRRRTSASRSAHRRTSARTGWDSIANYSQVTDNDVIEWSNRGPGANGRNGVDVVADGSYAPGDATLNTVIDGKNAWTTWGGTSRSTPVAVGEAALVYQAYKAAHGGPSRRRRPSRRSSSRQPTTWATTTSPRARARSTPAGRSQLRPAGAARRSRPTSGGPGLTEARTAHAFPRHDRAGWQPATKSFTIGGPATA